MTSDNWKNCYVLCDMRPLRPLQLVVLKKMEALLCVSIVYCNVWKVHKATRSNPGERVSGYFSSEVHKGEN